jgi:hypothetical protein
MPAPTVIKELIDRFTAHAESYRSSSYNETQLRREFLDPMFEALGWDVYNKNGYAEAYKDVIHEDAIKISGGTKAPDYCFRIGGNRKFFVEAKRPSVNIRQNPEPAFQIRRYAWSAKLPLAILTDFEEFAVYDCRTEPSKSDPSSKGRIMCLQYAEYLEKWDEVAAVFSREAILRGAFDKYAEAKTPRKGTTEVDDAFLKVIDGWRELLARNMALRNPDISARELNFAVQRTIDRIVFLRICEDRGIEEYGGLRSLQQGEQTYQRLADRFLAADDKYNSGLFHFRRETDRPEPPDDLTLTLSVDDLCLRSIFRQLYYPESPYEFSVLPADILGQVYERFLGKVIRLSPSHRALVEYKPEVKKAGGVFYTPAYIVSFMVSQTVGSALAKKTPNQVSTLKVLDPACGSGSFLLAAYQFLLDWHLRWYHEHDPEMHARGKNPQVYRSRNGWKLTTSERKRILLNNIYGVDIDAQAVETTKLSLLLKVLEGETAETVGHSLRLFHERALPDLSNNVRCGNAIIGPDFYDDDQRSIFNADERLRVNAFDWSSDFSEVFRHGGFDVILGNPPYVDIKALSEESVEYIFRRYKTANNRINLFATFIEKSISLMRPKSGRLAMIVPTALASQESYKALRATMLERLHLSTLVRLPNESFGAKAGDVKVDTMIFVLQHGSKRAPTEIISFAGYNRVSQISGADATARSNVDTATWKASTGSVWSFNTLSSDERILRRCETETSELQLCAEFSLGLTPYDKYRGHTPRQIEERVFHSSYAKDATFKRLLAGNDVRRYLVQWGGEEWISYGPWLGAPREQRFFLVPRILVKQIIDWTSKRIWAAMTQEELYNTQNAFNLIAKDGWGTEYLLGIINSKLMTYYHRKRYLDEYKMRFQKILIKDCRKFPIRNLSGEAEEAHANRITQGVRRMMGLLAQKNSVRLASDGEALNRLIRATDADIDRAVYSLYQLSEEDAATVESEVSSL